jgi:putative acetyltransferase
MSAAWKAARTASLVSGAGVGSGAVPPGGADPLAREGGSAGAGPSGDARGVPAAAAGARLARGPAAPSPSRPPHPAATVRTHASSAAKWRARVGWRRIVLAMAEGSVTPEGELAGLTVRPERAGEATAIAAVVEAAFGGPIERAIVDDLRGTDRWIEGGSIVAVAPDGMLVGHLLVSEGDLLGDDGNNRRIWMLGPVAVLPAWQGRGLGAMLMHAAIELATRRRQPVLCLLGHASYYPRFGFEPARRMGIEPPASWPDENWMALRLPAWTPDVRGVARFPPAFPTD